MIRLESLNVAPARPLEVGRGVTRSGIRKKPTAQAVLTVDGFQGDEQADQKHHGGPDQAAYVYRTEDYAWWSERLGRVLPMGILGENLTLSGLSEDARIGDRVTLGGVLLEVTAPRVPCHKLAARMNDPHFVKTFAAAGRPGFYTRVLRGGSVRVGDVGAYTRNPEAAPTVAEALRWYFERIPDEDRLKAALSAPLSVRLRNHVQAKLASAGR